MQLIIFLFFFSFLFFLSRTLTSTISFFFFKFTKSSNFSIHVLSFLFLPGVIIHELSHWLVASILFVPTGEIEFLPKAHGESIKLGSVQIGITDPFRRFVIGVAPILVGLGIILLIFQFVSPISLSFSFKSLLFFYVIFEIGNTMFSSKKDLEGIFVFAILFFLFVSILFFLKVPLLDLLRNFITNNVIGSLVLALNYFILIAIIIDAIIIAVLRLLLRTIV